MIDVDKIIPKVRRWADGTVMPDYVFENEPDEATVLRWASIIWAGSDGREGPAKAPAC